MSAESGYVNVVGEQRKQVAVVDVSAAGDEGMSSQDAVDVVDRSDAVGVVGKLLNGDRGGGHRPLEPAAVDLGRERDAEQPRASQLVEHRPGKGLYGLIGLGDAMCGWRDDTLGEFPHFTADALRLVVGEQVVIDPVGLTGRARSMRCRLSGELRHLRLHVHIT